MRALIDTNILLDVLLDRAPWADEASQIWNACDTGRLEGYVPASAITDIFYIARRSTDVATAQLAVGLCLATFQVSPVDRLALEQATSLPGNDFEDNLQVACAHLSSAEAIVTRNPRDFAASLIPVLSPGDLLARL